jgi:hypothetical protein
MFLCCRLALPAYRITGIVKRHVSNISGKLDATSRTGAVARARALGLLYTAAKPSLEMARTQIEAWLRAANEAERRQAYHARRQQPLRRQRAPDHRDRQPRQMKARVSPRDHAGVRQRCGEPTAAEEEACHQWREQEPAGALRERHDADQRNPAILDLIPSPFPVSRATSRITVIPSSFALRCHHGG